MNHALRQQLRHAIDQHARQRRQAFVDNGELFVCAKCGCDIEQCTAGCSRCHDRKRRRKILSSFSPTVGE